MPQPARRPARTATRRAAPARAAALASTEPRLDHVSKAYQELRRIIVWGQLPPGARVSERTIADRLNLSRTPVRSALHRLEQEGFVTAVGTGRERRLIVSPLTVDDGLEVFTIVGHLEGLAARTAAELPAPRRKALAARMRSVNNELARQASRKNNANRFFELDIEFHSRYVEGVAGPRVLTLHQAIKPQSERYIRLYVSVLVDQIALSVREHEKITAAIARGDADAAQRAVETNWRNAADRLAEIITELGERGSWHA